MSLAWLAFVPLTVPLTEPNFLALASIFWLSVRSEYNRHRGHLD